MAVPQRKQVNLVIRNLLWPLHGLKRPTVCIEDGTPLANQTGVEIDGNCITVKLVVDGEKVRFE